MTKIVLHGDNIYLRTTDISSGKMNERYFQIYLKEKVIGEISFANYSMTHKSAELSIKIYEEHKGKGFTREAVTLLSDYYFYLYNGKYLVNYIHRDNVMAQEYFGKIGFEQREVQGEHLVYKMTKEKFNQFKLSC